MFGCHLALYPGIQFDSILGADGAGTVVSEGHELSDQAVLISPEVGWRSSTLGPDESFEFGILGGTRQTGGRGTFAEYIAVSEKDVVPCPQHLLQNATGWEDAAALPLAALTAYRCIQPFRGLRTSMTDVVAYTRATFTKAEVQKGHNVLITGIGGG